MVTYHYDKFYVSIIHEAWWSYRYMFLVGPKVFSFVVKGVKVILRGSKGVGIKKFDMWVDNDV
jgi:hypothetical protein